MTMQSIIAELTVPLTLAEVATILGIFSVIFTVGAAVLGARFLPRATYYAQRQTDLDRADACHKELEARQVALETAIKVITEADLKSIAKAMEGLREEIAGMSQVSATLNQTLVAFDKRLTVIELAEREGRGKGRR